MATYFISGIDTDAGKSVVTGVIARTLHQRGVKVITQKFIQTGCQNISEDIEKHRQIMGIPLTEADKRGTTCAYIMTYPASPHLAAEIDGITIDTDKIHQATLELEKEYSTVLIEGAGGLYVPVTRKYLTIDYIVDHNYPLILVVSAKLGSINHALMSLELCRIKGVDVRYVIYNDFMTNGDPILHDSFRVIHDYLKENFPKCILLELPIIKDDKYPDLNIAE